MGSNSLLCNVIHPLGTDLDLDPQASHAHEGAVQGFITVAFRVFHPVPYTIRLVAVNACNY